MDIYKIIENLKTRPHTYSTLIGEVYTNNSHHRCIRRKLNKQFKKGLVYKTLVPGKKFSLILFYSPDKQYSVFFVQQGLKTRCLYSKAYTETAIDVSLQTVYELCGVSWKRTKNITIDKEQIIKVI